MIKNRKGFTLIELLLVVAIIAILAVVVFVALNPAKRLKDSKDSRRATDIQNILTAVHAYVVDNSGNYPAGLTAGMSEAQLGTATTGAAIATGGCTVTTTAALSLATPLTPYLKSIPVDPSGTAALTKYSIVVDTNGIVTVRACGAENTTLSVSQ
jgi:prepilin-type N-terminal cleavage/methylation domain-containing protein